MTFVATPPPPPPAWPTPPPPRGEPHHTGSTSTFDTCPSHPCFYVCHTAAIDTWKTPNPALLDREGLFLLWYIRLLHILGIRPRIDGLLPSFISLSLRAADEPTKTLRAGRSRVGAPAAIVQPSVPRIRVVCGPGENGAS